MSDQVTIIQYTYNFHSVEKRIMQETCDLALVHNTSCRNIKKKLSKIILKLVNHFIDKGPSQRLCAYLTL